MDEKFQRLLKIEQRLGLNHCHLVGISGEGVYVQLGSPGLEVNVAEWLELADFQFREFYKHAPVPSDELIIRCFVKVTIDG